MSEVLQTRIGWALSGLVILFLLMDGYFKLFPVPEVLASQAELGYRTSLSPVLGAVILVIALLYALPASRVLGAILLTGFLGGAVASHVRIGSPLFSHVLFGVYIGVLAWAGLYLREPALRRLMPLTTKD